MLRGETGQSLPHSPESSSPITIPRRVTVSLVVLSLAGTGGFLAAVFGSDPLRAWQAYLVNFLFWTGLAFGAILFVAVLNITGARWGRPIKRCAEALGAFLPPAFLLFCFLYLGKDELFPWVRHPVQGKEAWLNAPFLFVRDGAAILLLTFSSLAMIHYSLKGDRQWPRDGEEAGSRGRSWAGSWRKQKVLSPLVAILYALVLSLMGFDLVMSLDPHWCSSLLGGYFFVGSFYAAVATLTFIAFIVGRYTALRAWMTPSLFHDLGKLMMAFCLFTGYLFYAQFLVIWYGNLPEETRYVILRVKSTPWEPLAWVALVLVFLVPFFVLLSRRIKVKRLPMILLAAIVMTGMWIERFILVAPSLWKKGGIPLGITEALVTVGYLGIVGLCVTGFLSRVPFLPLSDPLFRELLQKAEERPEP
jgi:hypothetical protein